MDNSLKIILECLENNKTKFFDDEYKIMIEELQKIHYKQQNNVKIFNIQITYLDTDLKFFGKVPKKLSMKYGAYATKNKVLLLKNEEFKNFYESDEKEKIFNNDKLLDDLLPFVDKNNILYYTIYKEEIY